jgi:hypothetical protein
MPFRRGNVPTADKAQVNTCFRVGGSFIDPTANEPITDILPGMRGHPTPSVLTGFGLRDSTTSSIIPRWEPELAFSSRTQGISRDELINECDLFSASVRVADLVVNHPEPVSLDAREPPVQPAGNLPREIEPRVDDMDGRAGHPDIDRVQAHPHRCEHLALPVQVVAAPAGVRTGNHHYKLSNTRSQWNVAGDPTRLRRSPLRELRPASRARAGRKYDPHLA